MEAYSMIVLNLLLLNLHSYFDAPWLLAIICLSGSLALLGYACALLWMTSIFQLALKQYF
jgi:hypothetical protein